jgi:flagellar biosynthesis protein
MVDKAPWLKKPTAPPADEPTRQPIAVAIEDDPSRRSAPRVIAKGRGAFAEQILEIAFDRGVRVRSDADLAEILAAVEVDSEIPLEALAAVAEILSYVYRAQGRLVSDLEP